VSKHERLIRGGRLAVVLEVIALLAFGLLVLRLGWNVVVQASTLNAWWLLLPAALVAYLARIFFREWCTGFAIHSIARTRRLWARS